MLSHDSRATVGKNGLLGAVGRVQRRRGQATRAATVMLAVAASLGGVTAGTVFTAVTGVLDARPAAADTVKYFGPTAGGDGCDPYVVPSNVVAVQITAIGDPGTAGANGSDGGGSGGLGGIVTATVQVTPGSTLTLAPEGIPAWSNGPDKGGATGGDGGWGSFVTTQNVCGPPADMSDILVAAGGGGGGGGGDDFGAGGTGGNAGSAGNPGGSNEAKAGAGGGAGTVTGGGAGGAGGAGGDSQGFAGSFLHGGSSGSTSSCGCGEGGSGGGGFFGGGGGGASGGDGAGGGGGGSNYVTSAATNVSMGTTTVYPPYISITPVLFSTTINEFDIEPPAAPSGTPIAYAAFVDSPAATGVIDFTATDGSRTFDLGPAPVQREEGQLQTASLPTGIWSVTATYLGDSTDLASAPSSALTETIGAAPSIVRDVPTTSATLSGTQVLTLSASASGDDLPSAQWQHSLDGGATWTDITGGSSSPGNQDGTPVMQTSLTLSAGSPGPGQVQAINGATYRAYFSNSLSSVPSSDVTITVETGVRVLLNPTDVVSPVGGSVQFFSAATGSPAPASADVQWQVSTDGGSTWTEDNTDATTFQTVGSSADTSLTVDPVAHDQSGYEYRTMFQNTVNGVTNSVLTTPATLSVVNPCIVNNPQPPPSSAFSQCDGVDLTGTSLLTINLDFGQYSHANLKGQTLRAVNGANLSGADLQDVNATSAGLQLANLTGANVAGATLTGADLEGATLTGTSLIPANVTATTTDPSVTSATVTWPTPANLPGATFDGCDHASGASFPLGPTTVTCTVLDDAGKAATGTFIVTIVTPTAPIIASTPTEPDLGQPSNITVTWSPAPFFSVSFTAIATGNPDPTVQWQVLGSTGWTNISGANSFRYMIDNPAVTGGTEYRAVFTNSGGITMSSAATLTVLPIVIPTQISGGQTYGGQAQFNFGYSTPPGVTVTGSATCSTAFMPLARPQSITSDLAVGNYQLTNCSGLTPSKPNYVMFYSGTFDVSPVAITQNAPTSGTTTTAASHSFTDQLNAVSPDGQTVAFSQNTGSGALTVSSSGSVHTSGPLVAGQYTATGVTSTANGGGTWTYTLEVNAETIQQSMPTGASVALSGASTFTTTLSVSSGSLGPVTFMQQTGSGALVVSSSGAVKTTGALGHGQYIATGTTSDTFGDSGQWTFTLSVSDADLSIAPVSTVSAVGTSATVPVTFTPPTASDEDGTVPVMCDHSSGSSFPIGTTKVTCSASDADDTPSSVSSSFNVVVSDADLSITTIPSIVVNATASSGTSVSFVKPSAKDGITSIAVTCDHVSGATFAIGVTTVTCEATSSDDTPSLVTSHFTVSVKSALSQLQDLLSWEQGQRIPPGNSVVNKTQSAISYLGTDDVMDTCISLTAIVNQAGAQSGKQLTKSQAAFLTSAATNIRSVLACPRGT